MSKFVVMLVTSVGIAAIDPAGPIINQQNQARGQNLVLKGQQPASAKSGIYLKRGVGAQGRIELGWIVDKMDSTSLNMLNDYKDLYGLEYGLNDTTDAIRFLKCNKWNCYTDNNIAVGDMDGIVYKRFGKPIQSVQFKKKQETFIAYEGVAFMIDSEGLVKEIYILPLPVIKKR